LIELLTSPDTITDVLPFTFTLKKGDEAGAA